MYVKITSSTGMISYRGPFYQAEARAFAYGAQTAGAEAVLVAEPKRAKLDQHEYADSGMCPHCGAGCEHTKTTDTGQESPDGFTQGMKCTACGAEWISTYSLSGYFGLEVDGEYVVAERHKCQINCSQ